MSPSPLPSRPRPTAPRARARAPLSPTPGPCNLHAARAAPPSVPAWPQPGGLSPLPPPYAGSWAAHGSRTFQKAPRSPGGKGQVASFPGGARSFTSAAGLEKPRKCSPFLPPPATRLCGLRGALATNRRARWRGRPLSRSGVECACALCRLFTCPEPARRTLLAAAARVQSPELWWRKSW